MTDKALQPIQDDQLDALLNDTLISQEEIETIQVSETGKTLRDTLLSLGGPWGEAAKTFFELNDKIDDKVKERKKEYLLLRLYENSQHNDDFMNKFKEYIVNPQFSILFNKLIRILYDGTDNKAYIDKLSLVLKKIIDGGDFSSEFEGYKYILDQIEKLSPQAILVLSDFPWPHFVIEAPYETNELGIVTSGWTGAFAQEYSKKRNLRTGRAQYRLENTIKELNRAELIKCHIENQRGPSNFGNMQEQLNPAYCSITALGEEIAVYLK